MTRRERGFTLVELAIVVSILAVVVPLILVFGRALEARDREIQAQQAFAASARTVSEELRRDLHLGVAASGLSFTGDATCGAVSYQRNDEGVLLRKSVSCGERFVARDVEKVEVANDRVSLHFMRPVGGTVPARGLFSIGLPGVLP